MAEVFDLFLGLLLEEDGEEFGFGFGDVTEVLVGPAELVVAGEAEGEATNGNLDARGGGVS